MSGGGRVAEMLRRDAAVPLPGMTRPEAAAAWLGIASYAAGVATIVLVAVNAARGTVAHLSQPGPAQTAVNVAGLLLVARAAAAVRAWPDRRRATVALLVATVLFAAGGATVGLWAGVWQHPLVFSSVFLPGYAALGAFLVLDVPDGFRFPLAPTLDAAVLGGSVCCLAAVPLTGIAESVHGVTSGATLLTLGYVLGSVGLAVFVLVGVVSGNRDMSSRTIFLLCGLGLLAAAHTVLLGQQGGALTGPAVAFPAFLVCGITLVVRGGCGPRLPPRAPRGAAERNTVPVALAAVVPVSILAATQELALAVVCVLTLAAVTARLALALRDARQGAAEAIRASRTDDLTGLANRRAVVALAEADDGDARPLGLVVAGLDGFTLVNNTLGPGAGDALLRALADRLGAELGGAGLLARLGGDEFALLARVDGTAAAHAEADRVRDLIARPVDVLGHPVTMAASAGIAVRATGPDAPDGPGLLRQATIAMHQAKEQRSGALMYHPDQDHFTLDRLRAAEDLRRGIPGELRVWYQPQVAAGSRRVAGVEALVRWQHPGRGLVPPDEFLGVARQAGLMPRITEAVAETVLADAGQLLAAGVRTRLALNIAPAELLNAALLDRLLAAVGAARLPGGMLTLEVTEDSFLADPDRARAALETISEHRVEVSVDDYGSGFSSLAYLRDLPVHELKMDRSFVTGVGADDRSRIIVASTAAMAKGLGLRTVAEGVEDAAAADELSRLGVDILQGYHFARPMPLPDLQRWLAAHREALAPA